MNRALSWSSISSFEYDKEQWYRSYILGEKQTSAEMDFGSLIDKRIQEDATFLPHLPRYSLMQHKMNVMFSGIPLVGLPDGLDLVQYLLADYKTGKKEWTQQRADETGQLTMYLLLVFITYKIPPDKFRCFIHWLPTVAKGDFSIELIDDSKFITIETKRTMKDLLLFGLRIKKVYKEMKKYIKNHP